MFTVSTRPEPKFLIFRLFQLFSGLWGQIEAASVEVNRMNEVLLVPKAPRRVLHPLDLGIDRFAGRISDPMPRFVDQSSAYSRRDSLPPCLAPVTRTNLENAFYTTFGVVNQGSNSCWGARHSGTNCLCPLFNVE
jgi:hypothetical protein